MAPTGTRRTARAKLRALRLMQEDLVKQAEELYTSLDVGEEFPHIRDFGMEFTRTLVLAHDAKRVAQRRLRGHVQVIEELDAPEAGADNALGEPVL